MCSTEEGRWGGVVREGGGRGMQGVQRCCPHPHCKGIRESV